MDATAVAKRVAAQRAFYARTRRQRLTDGSNLARVRSRFTVLNSDFELPDDASACMRGLQTRVFPSRYAVTAPADGSVFRSLNP